MSEPYSVDTVTDFTTLYYEEDCSILHPVYQLGSIILSEFTPSGICNSCLRIGQTWSLYKSTTPMWFKPSVCPPRSPIAYKGDLHFTVLGRRGFLNPPSPTSPLSLDVLLREGSRCVSPKT